MRVDFKKDIIGITDQMIEILKKNGTQFLFSKREMAQLVSWQKKTY